MKALELAKLSEYMVFSSTDLERRMSAELRRLAEVNAELLEVLEDARLLCEWISESPHQRGSINGAAAQLLYKIYKAKDQQ